MFYGDFERGELLFLVVGLYLVVRGHLIDSTGSLILALLETQQVVASAFSLVALFGGAVGYTPGCVFNMNILLDSEENVSHLGDFVLHQVLVKRVGNLQPTDECCH